MNGSEGKVVLMVDIPQSCASDPGVDPSVCDILISTAFRLSGNDVRRLHSLMICTMAKYIHDVSVPDLWQDVDNVVTDIRRSHREYADLMCGDVPDTGRILNSVSVGGDCDEGELVLEPFNVYERDLADAETVSGHLDIDMDVDGMLLENILDPDDTGVIALCVIDPVDDSVSRILAYVDGDSIRVQREHGCGGCCGCCVTDHDGGNR